MSSIRLNQRSCCALAVCLVLSLTASSAWAVDTDGDGVPDGTDVCCNTPPGTPVNSVGRPVADLDNDCDVDMVDFGIFQVSLTGPMSCSPEVCDGIDNDCNCIVDDVGTLTCGTGACQVTVPSCVNGVPQTCTPGTPSPEVCDGIDNDCDGSVDEGVGAATWYEDQDGDGYGNPAVWINSCNPPPGYVALPGDCYDLDASVNPAASELCNGVDDDCNGTVDDNASGGTAWYPDLDGDGYGDLSGQVIACTAPAGYVAQSYDCDDQDPSTHPGAIETCNAVDDDCDGYVDEGLGTITCGTGACQVTVPACAGGQPNPCTPGNSSPEICDGIDNDCDGMIDEGLVGCGSNCPGNPQPEVCDGLDNDCDSLVDEGLGSTTCGTGACQTTIQNCVNGTPQTCTPGNSSPEVCDGIDNDCDGMIDEGNPCPPAPNASTGSCMAGSCVYTCDPGYSDCNGLAADGCEVAIGSNPQHCGQCGSVCTAGPNQAAICSSGNCVFVCNVNYADCDNNSLNGCEINVKTDPNHCGSCNNVCPTRPNATTTCSNGNCSFICNPGYADCNGNAADGCEVNLNTNNSHCGTCNATCSSGYTCVNGQCVVNPN